MIDHCWLLCSDGDELAQFASHGGIGGGARVVGLRDGHQLRQRQPAWLHTLETPPNIARPLRAVVKTKRLRKDEAVIFVEPQDYGNVGTPGPYVQLTKGLLELQDPLRECTIT